MLSKCVLTILDFNWDQRFLGKNLSSYAHVHHTTAKQVISRHGKNEDVYETSINENRSCKACKTNVFDSQIRKFMTFQDCIQSDACRLQLGSQTKCHRTLLVNFIITSGER